MERQCKSIRYIFTSNFTVNVDEFLQEAETLSVQDMPRSASSLSVRTDASGAAVVITSGVINTQQHVKRLLNANKKLYPLFTYIKIFLMLHTVSGK